MIRETLLQLEASLTERVQQFEKVEKEEVEKMLKAKVIDPP